MTKKLILMRHGKSSWKNDYLEDYERPLNKRGKADVPYMASVFKTLGLQPDLIISSNAVRAFDTAKEMASSVGFDSDNINVVRSLYLADIYQILSVIQCLPEKCQNVVIVGHNPGLTEFVNHLSNESLDNVPTSGIFVAEIDGDWENVKFGMGKRFWFSYPKAKEVI
ncbi:SixA phosphatase family protein [Aureibacter tunicatorum]|uniref:Phosphohistidine phosphatase n=1 Tax=Aureibacter tunicatorum TaxID=866807 RepID=A0AAE3XNI0_9BACT|nr:histidine phosphatase family protein [Aureibacter tunicatorum]MDR6239722.1 phosphohistidine phosphatase [Aureibacter tunicatorum]BDD04198.1 phosphoglycerate mutase [Aureibacter tunicatorum]